MTARSDSSLPLVSVVMPAYNHERFVEEAVQSVWAQTYPYLELVVLNDGSPDGTGAVLDRLQPISPIPMRVVHKANEGLCRTLNRGLAMVSGEFVAFAASDDRMEPSKLEREVEALRQAGPDVGAAYGDMQAVSETGDQPLFRITMQPKRGTLYQNMLRGEVNAYIQACVFRRDAVERTGGFDPSLHFEDLDFLLRFAHRFALVYAGGLSVRYRTVVGSLKDSLVNHAGTFETIAEKQLRDGGHRVFGRFAERKVRGYTQARIAAITYMAGRMPEARRRAVRALSYWPFDRRPWSVLALSSVPRPVALSVLALRRGLRSRAAAVQRLTR